MVLTNKSAHGSPCYWTWTDVPKSSTRFRRTLNQLMADLTNFNFKSWSTRNLLTLVMVRDAHHIPIGIELNFKFESSSMWYIIVPNITVKGLFINDSGRNGNTSYSIYTRKKMRVSDGSALPSFFTDVTAPLLIKHADSVESRCAQVKNDLCSALFCVSIGSSWCTVIVFLQQAWSHNKENNKKH